MRRRVAFVTSVGALVANLALPHGNTRGEAKVALGGKSVAIEYGRPTLKGRDMLAKAEVGKAWRVGADDATTLTTETDLAFGSELVPAGKYVLSATKLAAETWQLELKDPKTKKTAARAPLASSKLAASVETFTIEIREKDGGAELWLEWGATALSTSFRAR